MATKKKEAKVKAKSESKRPKLKFNKLRFLPTEELVKTYYFFLGFCAYLMVIMMVYMVAYTGDGPAIQNVKVTNVGSDTATITWKTKEPVYSFVAYSADDNWRPFVNGQEKGLAFDDRDMKTSNVYGDYIDGLGSYYTHHVTLTNLDPKTVYSYRIVYDNKPQKNVTYPELKTGTELTLSKAPYTIQGMGVAHAGMIDLNGDGLVYVTVKDRESGNTSAVLSTYLDEDGRFSLDIANARKADNSDFVGTIDGYDIVSVDVVSGDDYGSGFTSDFVANANPLTPVVMLPEGAKAQVLSESYNFASNLDTDSNVLGESAVLGISDCSYSASGPEPTSGATCTEGSTWFKGLTAHCDATNEYVKDGVRFFPQVCREKVYECYSDDGGTTFTWHSREKTGKRMDTACNGGEANLKDNPKEELEEIKEAAKRVEEDPTIIRDYDRGCGKVPYEYSFKKTDGAMCNVKVTVPTGCEWKEQVECSDGVKYNLDSKNLTLGGDKSKVAETKTAIMPLAQCQAAGGAPVPVTPEAQKNATPAKPTEGEKAVEAPDYATPADLDKFRAGEMTEAEMVKKSIACVIPKMDIDALNIKDFCIPFVTDTCGASKGCVYNPNVTKIKEDGTEEPSGMSGFTCAALTGGACEPLSTVGCDSGMCLPDVSTDGLLTGFSCQEGISVESLSLLENPLETAAQLVDWAQSWIDYVYTQDLVVYPIDRTEAIKVATEVVKKITEDPNSQVGQFIGMVGEGGAEIVIDSCKNPDLFNNPRYQDICRVFMRPEILGVIGYTDVPKQELKVDGHYIIASEELADCEAEGFDSIQSLGDGKSICYINNNNNDYTFDNGVGSCNDSNKVLVYAGGQLMCYPGSDRDGLYTNHLDDNSVLLGCNPSDIANNGGCPAGWECNISNYTQQDNSGTTTMSACQPMTTLTPKKLTSADQVEYKDIDDLSDVPEGKVLSSGAPTIGSACLLSDGTPGVYESGTDEANGGQLHYIVCNPVKEEKVEPVPEAEVESAMSKSVFTDEDAYEFVCNTLYNNPDSVGRLVGTKVVFQNADEDDLSEYIQDTYNVPKEGADEAATEIYKELEGKGVADLLDDTVTKQIAENTTKKCGFEVKGVQIDKKVLGESDESLPFEIVNGELILRDTGLYELEFGYDIVAPKLDVQDGNAKLRFYIDLNANGRQDPMEEFVPTAAYLGMKITKSQSDKVYNVNEGWNMMAIPVYVKEDFGAKDLFDKMSAQGIDVLDIAVFRSGKWFTYSYDPDGGRFYNESFAIGPSEGIFVRTSNAGSFKLSGNGYESGVPIYMRPGWGLIGIAGTKTNYTGVSLLEAMEASKFSVSKLVKWNSGRFESLVMKNGLPYGSNYFESISDQEGYMILVDEGTGVFVP